MFPSRSMRGISCRCCAPGCTVNAAGRSGGANVSVWNPRQIEVTAGQRPMSDDRERLNILLVDDRPDQLLVLQSILNDLGETLVCAQSGRDALRFLLQQDCAVILLDVNMPDLDG